jgi:hypothetical protein
LYKQQVGRNWGWGRIAAQQISFGGVLVVTAIVGVVRNDWHFEVCEKVERGVETSAVHCCLPDVLDD